MYDENKTQELPKTYNAKKVEADIYKTWESSGYFNPDNLPGKRKESFTISLPSPNLVSGRDVPIIKGPYLK